MASLAELMVRVGADISEFSRQMQTVERTMQTTGQSLRNVGNYVGQAGSQMAQAVTLPILALGTTAVVVGAQFDKQMSKVQAISGATASEFEQLRAKALELGSSTSFSSSEVASAMENLASAGFNTNQILSSTKGVLDLAASAGIGLAEASEIAGSALNGFGLDASQAGHVADVLAKASAISATNATGLGYAFKYIAPVAKTLGISLEETAGAVGLLANAGIDGSSAGTALRMGLLRLASPTKEMGELMQATGSQFFDANGKMKNLAGIIDTLKQATKGMTDEQKTNYLATLFGAEAVSSFMVLMDAGAGKINEYTNQLKNSSGEAGRMAETMTNNLAGAWDELTGALEALAISFSDVVKGDLQRLAEKITELVNWFNSLDAGTKKVIVVIGLLLASLAPLLIVIGFVAQGVGALVTLFGMITAPVLAVIAVIVAVGVALVALWKQSETFRNGVTEVFNAVKGAITQALGVVVSFVREKIDQIKKFWDENGKQILQAVENAWNGIKKVIEFVMPAILFIVKMIWDSIKGVIDGALNVIMGLIKVFAGLFTGDWKKLWEGIKQFLGGAIEFIWNLLNLMFIGRILTGIKTFATSAINLFKTWGTNIMNFFKNLWDDAWNTISRFVQNSIEKINYFQRMGANIFQAVRQTIVEAIQGAKTTATNLFNGLKDGAISAFNSLKSTVQSIFNSVKSFITNPIESAKNTVLGIIDKIVSAFRNMRIEIPRPRLPKISVSMKKGAMGIPYPDFDVSWNAKGGIFNGATLLGGGQGVGEKGAEAVLPIQHKRYMAPFARAVAEHMDTMNGKGEAKIENNFQIAQLVVREEADIDRIAQKLYEKQKRTNRGGGR
jgi:TP901 family phage tail tape measure protein